MLSTFAAPFLEILFGTLLALGLLRLKRIPLADNGLAIFYSILTFGLLVPAVLWVGSMLSQSTGLIELARPVAIVSLLIGLVLRTVWAIPFLFAGLISLCSVVIGPLVFQALT
ncbi:hypothetical protein [Deinococcus altitudinis]|uniref:hypothetical protein n=1 Tax=Deinococcus altitudinis TaxID=468914 RepID=UPI0038924F4D